MYRKRRASYSPMGGVYKRARTTSRKGAIRRGTAGYNRTSSLYNRRFLSTPSGRRPERKFLNTSGTIPKTTDNRTNPQWMNINLVPQGAGATQRIGSKISVDEIEYHSHVRRLNTETPDFTPNNLAMPLTFRTVLVLDKQANGDSPDFSDVFDTDAQPDPTLAVPRVDNNMRFKILKDMKKKIDPGQIFMNEGLTPDGLWIPGTSADFDFKVKLKTPITIEFGGSTGSINEVRSNNLLVFTASSYWDNREDSPQGPEVEVNAYIRYTDY